MNENDEKTTKKRRKNLLNKRKGRDGKTLDSHNKRKGRDGKPWFPAIKGRGVMGNLGFPQTYLYGLIPLLIKISTKKLILIGSKPTPYAGIP